MYNCVCVCVCVREREFYFSLDHEIVIVPWPLGHNRYTHINTHTLTKMQNQPCRGCLNQHDL